jgi:hypothetical protein
MLFDDNKGQKKIAAPKRPGDISNSQQLGVAESLKIPDLPVGKTLRLNDLEEKEGGNEEHSNNGPTSDVEEEEDLNSNLDEQRGADRSESPAVLAKIKPLDGMLIIN